MQLPKQHGASLVAASNAADNRGSPKLTLPTAAMPLQHSSGAVHRPSAPKSRAAVSATISGAATTTPSHSSTPLLASSRESGQVRNKCFLPLNAAPALEHRGKEEAFVFPSKLYQCNR